MRFGTQTYGLLNGTTGDVTQILGELKGLGLSFVEPCVWLGDVSPIPRTIWTMQELRERVLLLREEGLSVSSCHIFGDNLLSCAAELEELCSLGIRQFVVKSPRDMSDRSLQEAALGFMQLADLAAPFGGSILLHNEKYDIEQKTHGKTVFEHMLDLCLGRVLAQADVGWAMAGGEDAEAFLWRNAHRVASVHLKDLSGEKEVPVGTGDLPLEACFQFARAFGLPMIVDTDSFGGDPFAELKADTARLSRLGQCRDKSVSYLNVFDLETGRVKTLASFDRVIEAPNWVQGSETLLYNSGGRIYRYDIAGGEETCVDTGVCTGCNNDHVLSPDGRSFAVSHGGPDPELGFTSRVYVIPMEGGEARLVTPNTPSFLHGWSPDGKELAYCAFRMHDGKMEVDIYAAPADGSGEERRITSGGFNDGPEYSPDGKYIWFNSTRSGLMQIYRMRTDGSEQTQMTDNARNNWFAHVSPDGKKVIYLSYREGDLDAAEHLPNMQVELWLMNADGSGKKRILSFFGGQGSINVNSWAADSRRFAFVSYDLLHS